METRNTSVAGRLSDKIAIVSGAGQTPGTTIGNGKAIAMLFARAGARVLCVDLNAAQGQQTVDEINSEGGQAALCVADVASAEGVAAIAAACESSFGPPDILVNNVGIADLADGPAHKLTEAAFDRTLRINLKGAWLLTQAVLPGMLERHRGSIVNISSLASVSGASLFAYELSKSGINRMTTSVAQTCSAEGVRSNAIMVGLMDTPMAITGLTQMTGLPEDQLRAQRAARVPMKRMGSAWDTAYAALFLASDEAAFITGTILPVDGGSSAMIG